MGSPKHLLRFPDNGSESTLLQILLNVHQALATHYTLAADVSWEPPVLISVCDEKQRSDMLNVLAEAAQIENTRIIIDAQPDAGPTSGLLAAQSFDASVHYLVTGCDYPMLTTDSLLQLLKGHVADKPAITCFLNESDWTEPLMAVWSPSALSTLSQIILSSESPVGPNRVIRSLECMRDDECSESYSVGVMKILPMDSSWIVNVNTIEDYERVRRVKNRDSAEFLDPRIE